ncbi:MAG TPA: SpoIIE family protein phosphatase [Thermopolyspora sp.]
MLPSGSSLPEALTLLLIEDDEADAFLVEELLVDSGMSPKIKWARSLAEGRSGLTGDVHCVLVDLSLPDAGELDALRQVLAMAQDTAVLVLTGLDDAYVGVRAVAAGAQDYLVKQNVLDGRLLARAIRYAIERKRADVAQRELVEARVLRQENARLERCLLPVPLLRNTELLHQATYLPGRRGPLAGDFYDTVQTPDGSVHAVIGDVCGHGPDEAALGAALRIAWRTLVIAGHTGNDLLRTLDSVLRNERRSEEIFTTLCTVTIVPDLGHTRMHVVGHPPPLLLRDGRLRVVTETPSGPPLGIFHDVRWRTLDVPLGDEWSLLLYTDGLIEASVDGGGHLLGTEGVMRLLHGRDPIDLDHLIAQVRELHQDPLADDLAAVLLSRRRPG